MHCIQQVHRNGARGPRDLNCSLQHSHLKRRIDLFQAWENNILDLSPMNIVSRRHGLKAYDLKSWKANAFIITNTSIFQARRILSLARPIADQTLRVRARSSLK